MEYIFSFSSRNNALKFCDAVNDFGGKAVIVNSPKIGGYGCGLAVKCTDYDLCQGVLNRGYYTTLRAVYMYDGYDYTVMYEN